MAKPNECYDMVIVESFELATTSGHRGKVSLRPIAGQVFDQRLLLEGPRAMVDTSRYKVGTRFRVKAKLTDRLGGGEFLYMHHSWPFPVVGE